jgi:hypothetical protein
VVDDALVLEVVTVPLLAASADDSNVVSSGVSTVPGCSLALPVPPAFTPGSGASKSSRRSTERETASASELEPTGSLSDTSHASQRRAGRVGGHHWQRRGSIRTSASRAIVYDAATTGKNALPVQV